MSSTAQPNLANDDNKALLAGQREQMGCLGDELMKVCPGWESRTA